MNDALCQMYYAKNGIARFICKKLGEKLKKSEAAGIPDLNTLFQYNMPFRAIAKMTGGMVSMEMVEGLLKGCKRSFQRTWKSNQRIFQKPEAEQAV